MTKQILFIIDRSGSMNGGKLDSAKKGIEDILTDASRSKSTIEMDDHAGLISFDDSIDRDVAISDLSATKDDIINALGELSPRDQTALYDAIGEGVDDLAANGGNEPWIICLTDGEENASHQFGTDTEVIEYARDKGINLRIIIIGIGDDVDHSVLQRIASSFEGQYVHSAVSSNSIRASIYQAAKAVAKGGTEKESLPERVEIDVEHGKTGDVEPEELQRHSIPCGIGKIKKNVKHWHHPVHKETPQPNLCGDITAELWKRMCRIVENSSHVMDVDMKMNWNLSVPVQYVDKEIFLELWPSRNLGHFCEYFSNIVGSLLELGRDDRWGNPCFKSGKPFIYFLDDLEFGRKEKKYTDKSIISPGIYIRDDYNSENLKDKKEANLQFGLAFSTLKAMDYYFNCRRHVVKDRSYLHSFMYSVMSMYSMSNEELDHVIENADIVGAWALPLFIVRNMSMIPPKMVLEYLMLILPMKSLRRREPIGGNPNYDVEMRALIQDISHVVGHLVTSSKYRHGSPEELWRLLGMFTSRRRMKYGHTTPELMEITANVGATYSKKLPSGYNVLPLGSYERDGKAIQVFEVTKQDEPFRSYCIQCAVDPSTSMTKVHCTCKDFKYNSGPGGKPCKHILLVWQDIATNSPDGDVAIRINGAFSTSETYI